MLEQQQQKNQSTPTPSASTETSFEQDLLHRVELLVLELLKHLHRCSTELSSLTAARSVELRFTTPKLYFDTEAKQWRRDRQSGYNAMKESSYKLPGSDGGKQLGESWTIHVGRSNQWEQPLTNCC